MKKILPSVSIIIPTYNEAEHIKQVIKDFIQTQYPNLLEIIVVDGGSTDNTKEIVINLSFQDRRIKLLKNPLKIQTTGLNMALNQSQGDIFLRADAHAKYAPDYIEKCVEVLQKSQALNVGGAQRFIANTPFQGGIALASKSFLGSGGAKYRNSSYDGFVDTVFLGCFWRESLLKVSGYATNNISNEDAELNLRLEKMQDSAIYISSQIKVWYFPRKDWQSLCLQYFQYGRGRYLTTTKHPHKMQLRGKIPFLSLFILTLLIFYNLFINHNVSFVIQIIAIFLLLLSLEALRVNYQYSTMFTEGIWQGNLASKPSLVKRYFYCFLSLFTIPAAHSCGYGYQLLLHNLQKLQKILLQYKIMENTKPS